jgi:phosphatidylglycerophosphate synthase
MTGGMIRHLGDLTLGRLCRFLAGRPLSPSAYSAIGVGWGAAAGALIWSGHHGWSLVAIFLAGLFDYLDGGVSRLRYGPNQTGWRYATAFHVLCDKTSDTVIVLGIAVAGLVGWPMALFAVISGVTLTATGRLGVYRERLELERSIFDRSDRILCLLILGLFGYWHAAVTGMCLMNTIGIAQRIYVTSTASVQRGSRA